MHASLNSVDIPALNIRLFFVLWFPCNSLFGKENMCNLWVAWLLISLYNEHHLMRYKKLLFTLLPWRRYVCDDTFLLSIKNCPPLITTADFICWLFRDCTLLMCTDHWSQNVVCTPLITGTFNYALLLTTVLLWMAVFWVVSQCSVLAVCQRFGELTLSIFRAKVKSIMQRAFYTSKHI